MFLPVHGCLNIGLVDLALGRPAAVATYYLLPLKEDGGTPEVAELP